MDDVLKHIGVARRSGRYPWGSGEDGYQSNPFLNQYTKLKKEGLSQTEIAAQMGMNTRELRTNITWANKERLDAYKERVAILSEKGMTDAAIAKDMGISETSVRNYRKEKGPSHKDIQLKNVEDALRAGVEEHGYLDIGIGVEHQLGVPRTRFDAVVNKMLEEDGYIQHKVFVQRLADKDKPTTLKVLTLESDLDTVIMNQDKIRPLDSWSDDGGETIRKFKDPTALRPEEVKIRYAEDGGELKDGVMELRPGVEALEMGSSHYAQVRIKVGEDRYLKGMAIFGDPKDFPDGVNVIFNTNKTKGTDFRDVLKETKPGLDIEVFGSSIIRQNKSRVLNIVNEEGTWDPWSTALSAQFLSKQPLNLVSERLKATREGFFKEFDELNSLTHPVVKDYLMDKFSKSLVKRANHLDAKGIPGSKPHVLLPFPDMKPSEVYAPNYNNGDKVVLIRYPHGGTFELPEVTVNNKNALAKKIMGVAPDAIGIHPSVAHKLSGADFDGDTVWVVPNNNRQVKTSRSLKELKNFDPMDYKNPDGERTISKKYLGKAMGDVSNLITDMTIKNAPESEIARAVKHSMVVIDSYKHKLDYKRSARDNGIPALKKRYQQSIHPETGKPSLGASTLISRAKRNIKIDKEGFEVDKYSSGTQVESLYVTHVKGLQTLRNNVEKTRKSLTPNKYDPSKAKEYKAEIESLNKKIIKAQLNAPKERQAQILSNKLYYSNLTEDMSKEDRKKLKARSLARARDKVGTEGRESRIKLTDKEWEAIANNGVSTSKLKQVLRYGDVDQIRKYATPRAPKLTDSKRAQAQSLIDKGYTYAEVSQRIGVSVSSSSLQEP